MTYRTISKEDYSKLLELDKKVYPTDDPVTPEILDQWFRNNPEFGMIFEENGEISGMCIVIPLNKNGWNKLISGELLESDLNEDTIFDNNRDSELGIHVYHIEKFGDSKKKFYEESLTGLNELIKSLKQSNSLLKVIGFSGLCVTAQGIGLFYNKLNCRERDFINSEHILVKGGKLEIFDSDSQEELESKLNQDYEYINRCKMLVTYPGELSPVWKFL